MQQTVEDNARQNSSQSADQSLSLVQLRPDLPKLSQWAMRRGYLEQGCSDLGYALHAFTRAQLGEYAPRPFVLRKGADGIELLGYVGLSADGMHELAAARPFETSDEILGVQRLQAKDMPDEWVCGQRMGFEVRVRPVVRSRLGRLGGVREMDVAAWAARRDGPTGDKNELYMQWLDSRLRLCGSRLLFGRVKARTQTVVLRRSRKQGGREMNLCNGPDVLMTGTLEVMDAALFADGLLRGVGRHTGFGFGCLLLAPVAACY